MSVKMQIDIGGIAPKSLLLLEKLNKSINEQVASEQGEFDISFHIEADLFKPKESLELFKEKSAQMDDLKSKVKQK